MYVTIVLVLPRGSIPSHHSIREAVESESTKHFVLWRRDCSNIVATTIALVKDARSFSHLLCAWSTIDFDCLLSAYSGTKQIINGYSFERLTVTEIPSCHKFVPVLTPVAATSCRSRVLHRDDIHVLLDVGQAQLCFCFFVLLWSLSYRICRR